MNEILPSGQVVHIRELAFPKRESTLGPNTAEEPESPHGSASDQDDADGGVAIPPNELQKFSSEAQEPADQVLAKAEDEANQQGTTSLIAVMDADVMDDEQVEKLESTSAGQVTEKQEEPPVLDLAQGRACWQAFATAAPFRKVDRNPLHDLYSSHSQLADKDRNYLGQFFSQESLDEAESYTTEPWRIRAVTSTSTAL